MSKIKISPMMTASLAASGLLIACRWFFWDYMDLLTPFLAPFVIGGAWIVFGVVFVVSLFNIWRCRKSGVRTAAGAVCVNLAAGLFVFFAPIDWWVVMTDYAVNCGARKKVVDMVISGELKPNVSHNASLIDLPFQYKNLSKGGGQIVVEHDKGNTIVFFFTFRGILDHFSGFMFRSDNSAPEDGDLCGHFFEVEKLGEHWFWVGAA